MPQSPHNPHGFDPRQVVVLRPRKKRIRYRFHWELVAIVLAIMAIAWFLQNVEPIRWTSVMDALGVHDRDRYSRLAVWGIILCGMAMIWRVLRSSK